MSLLHSIRTRQLLKGRCERLALLVMIASVGLTIETPHTAFAQPDRTGSASASSDGWRRTSAGWEQMKPLSEASPNFAPSDHATLAQLWPAAWAACMILSIASLPSSKSNV